MEQKFYICSHCGKIVALVKESGVPVMCCGQKMQEIIPGTVDASKEKHVPVYTVEENKIIVKVGEVITSSIPSALAKPFANTVFPLPKSPFKQITIFGNFSDSKF